jgi:hypothetical protein
MRAHRNVLGSHNPKAKLTESDVPLIRCLRMAGMKRREVAEKFEVSVDAIAKIDQGVTWVHI